MAQPITMPLWAFVLVVLFAAVTFASHFLFPSVRWFFRKRAERAIARLNERLQRPIEPFKLARRYDMIQRLSYDPEVTQAVVEYARKERVPENVAFEKAQQYAREIVPSFSATAYFSVGIRLARWLSKSLYRIRLDSFDRKALADIDPQAAVIFVMNHRSNMDYVLVTYLAARASALSYAVGEWARVWPLRQLVRALGGFFIRRRHNNPLYRKVLARYVQMATEAGVTQAVFPEGRLSQTGALGAPKLGLISYILDGFTPGTSRDVVFVPVALNYDRVMEDTVLIEAHEKGTHRYRFSLYPIYRYVKRQIWHRLTGRFHRYGYAAVSFGDPLSLTDFLAQERSDPPAELGAELMTRIAAVMPVTPVPLVCFGLAQGHRTRQSLRAFVGQAVTQAQNTGITIHIPRDDLDYTVEAGLRALIERRLLTETADTLTLAPKGESLTAFYAASVAHLLEAT